METNVILEGDCLQTLKELPDASIHMCVTSPPYWGLRDYGHDDQLGLEETPEEYVENLVQVFREVRRVLRDDGTLWLNLGDSYAGSGKGRNADGTVHVSWKQTTNGGTVMGNVPSGIVPTGLKPKDLVGIPWMVAFALRKDGWYLRQDIIWNKPNPMPESVQDRCTKSHEYIFLLSKSQKYYFDSSSIKEEATGYDGRKDTLLKGSPKYANKEISPNKSEQSFASTPHERWQFIDGVPIRNKRSVWNVATKPFKGAHFAAYPPALIEPCILAGSPEDGIVLDPFFGAGTTGLVALENNRQYIGCEINGDYIKMAEERLAPVVKAIHDEKVSTSIVQKYFTF